MNEYVVETTALTKQLKKQNAVSNINMLVPKGAIYGFIGSNGAGKTTTLKMICGLMKPTSGEITLFNNTRKEYMYRRIGALIEHVGAYPDLSAKENMVLKAIGLGLQDKRQVDELLTLLHLDSTSNKAVKHFSLGMKQCLGIALALLGKPDLLILDEPINGLDPEGIKEIRNTVLKLNEEMGITIIISSHILGELEKVATHYGIIKNGQLIEQITQSELTEKCKNYMALKVSDVQKTCFVLENTLNIHEYEVMEDNEVRVYTQDDSSFINTELMKHNIQISQIYYQKQDLESYFLDKIGGELHA